MDDANFSQAGKMRMESLFHSTSSMSRTKMSAIRVTPMVMENWNVAMSCQQNVSFSFSRFFAALELQRIVLFVGIHIGNQTQVV